MFNKNSIFQMSIESAHAEHRLMKKAELGEISFDHWVGLSNAVLNLAYNVWADNHDQAGRDIQIVDPQVANEHEEALFSALRTVVDTVGEVSFSDGGSAKLSVNKQFANFIMSFAVKEGWDYSDEVTDLMNRISDCDYDLKQAKKELARYNYQGVNPEALKAKTEAVENLTLRLEGLKKLKKDEIAKDYAKVRTFTPNDENKFRASFEHAIYDLIADQKAMTYKAYRDMKEAQKKARREKTKARNAAKKQAEAQAK